MLYTKPLRAICLSLCLTLCCLGAALAQKKPADIAREQGQAVVVLEALDAASNLIGQGSGFLVTAQGALVTNLHVVQGAQFVRVKLPNGDVYKTQDVVDVDDTKDIAILKLKGFKLPFVNLGDSDQTETGESITVISSPEGLTNSLSTGVVSGVRRLEGLRVFQITAPISQGSSGGAVFDANGNVIGIVTYLLKGGQNINFAVPINYARGMISDQVTRTLPQLAPPPPVAKKTPDGPPAPPIFATEPRPEEAVENELLSPVVRGRLGRSASEPVYVQPAEALTFFFRLLEGLGVYRDTDVANLTRTAALQKTKETATTEAYTVNYLSPFIGMTMTLNKNTRVLSEMELLVNWTLDDLERVFGNRYNKRAPDANGQRLLEFKVKKEEGTTQTRQIVAVQDADSMIRSVRFARRF